MEMWQIETGNFQHCLSCYEQRNIVLDDFIISSKISVLNYETTKVQNPLPMTVEIQISVDEAVNQIIWSK